MSVEIKYCKDGSMHEVTVTVYGNTFIAYANSIDAATNQLCNTISSNMGGYYWFNITFPTLRNDILSNTKRVSYAE